VNNPINTSNPLRNPFFSQPPQSSPAKRKIHRPASDHVHTIGSTKKTRSTSRTIKLLENPPPRASSSCRCVTRENVGDRLTIRNESVNQFVRKRPAGWAKAQKSLTATAKPRLVCAEPHHVTDRIRPRKNPKPPDDQSNTPDGSHTHRGSKPGGHSAGNAIPSLARPNTHRSTNDPLRSHITTAPKRPRAASEDHELRGNQAMKTHRNESNGQRRSQTCKVWNMLGSSTTRIAAERYNPRRTRPKLPNKSSIRSEHTSISISASPRRRRRRFHSSAAKYKRLHHPSKRKPTATTNKQHQQVPPPATARFKCPPPIQPFTMNSQPSTNPDKPRTGRNHPRYDVHGIGSAPPLSNPIPHAPKPQRKTTPHE